VLCVIFSVFATWFLNYYFVAELESRFGIYSSTAQIILLFAQLVVIYVITQRIFFKKLTRTEIVLLSAAYGLGVFSVLFLRYSGIDQQGIFNLGSAFSHRSFSLNPISFVFDAASDTYSIFVSILNILLFLPLKPILAANKLRPKWWQILAGFAAIELLQQVLNAGSFDRGDIVLYFAGYLAGCWVLRIYLSRKKDKDKEKIDHAPEQRM
jgi:glycopeptide antibiotics resistance protein